MQDLCVSLCKDNIIVSECFLKEKETNQQKAQTFLQDWKWCVWCSFVLLPAVESHSTKLLCPS